MTNFADRDHHTLHRQLTAALSLADELELTIVAIHIDEARSLLREVTEMIVAPPAAMPRPA